MALILCPILEPRPSDFIHSSSILQWQPFCMHALVPSFSALAIWFLASKMDLGNEWLFALLLELLARESREEEKWRVWTGGEAIRPSDPTAFHTVTLLVIEEHTHHHFHFHQPYWTLIIEFINWNDKYPNVTAKKQTKTKNTRWCGIIDCQLNVWMLSYMGCPWDNLLV